jgi:integrase
MSGRKRANGEGSLYQLPDGRWVAALSWRDAHGNLKRRKSVHPTREEADKALTKMKAERDGGIALSGPNPTLNEYLRAWLRDSVAVSVDPKTLEGYEVACRIHILPALGGVRIRDLTSRQIQALHAQKMRDGLATGTRQNIHRTLKRALKQAVAWGELHSNPADVVDSPKARVENEEEETVKALTDAQARQLFAAAEERGDRFRFLYVVAARTGLRQGELLALRWSDLDLDASPASLTLGRSLAAKIGGGHYYTPTKRKRQRRRVAILSEAAVALRAQRELQAEERAAVGENWQENGLVFPSTRGTPMSARNLYRRHFKPTLRSAGLPDISFHDLRHTFASIMLYEWGASPRMVQEALGHASIKITMDTYGHLLSTSQPDEIRRIEALLSTSSKRDVAPRLHLEPAVNAANGAEKAE